MREEGQFKGPEARAWGGVGVVSKELALGLEKVGTHQRGRGFRCKTFSLYSEKNRQPFSV